MTYLLAVQECWTQDDLICVVRHFFGRIGCFDFALARMPAVRAARSIVWIHQGEPGGWFESRAVKYRCNTDPILSSAYLNWRPFAWSEMKWQDCDARSVSCDGRRADDGLTVPVRYLPTEVGALCGISDGTLTLAAMERFQLSLLGIAIYQRFRELDPAGKWPDMAQPPALSVREREVLALVIDNKTDVEIAAVVGITTPTVRFHIRKAATKLGTYGRFATAIAAMQLNMLM